MPVPSSRSFLGCGKLKVTWFILKAYGLGFIGFRGLGFRGVGFRDLGFRGLYGFGV